ncbi:MAG: aminodeoxychorismate lyase [Xanthomonadales bacterium]|nr:aminodeoxychorismate lyase [Xanthomonadales bacterium]
MLECLVDGEISTLVSTTNRGLNYADGLFETLVVHHNRPRRWQAHMDRLGAGCERLGLIMPPQAILLREVQTVSAGTSELVVKIVLTRGGEARGYMPSEDKACVRIVSAHPYPKGIEELLRNGVDARVCNLRLAIQPALGGIKHLNRLEQVLASAELRDNGAAEGILMDREDHVICAIATNIFLVKEGRLLTPRLDRCGVRGVVRGQILAAFGHRCEQRRILLDQFHEADEVFICNSVKGVVPITAIDEQRFEIGPVTREVQNQLLQGARQE